MITKPCPGSTTRVVTVSALQFRVLRRECDSFDATGRLFPVKRKAGVSSTGAWSSAKRLDSLTRLIGGVSLDNILDSSLCPSGKQTGRVVGRQSIRPLFFGDFPMTKKKKKLFEHLQVPLAHISTMMLAWNLKIVPWLVIFKESGDEL